MTVRKLATWLPSPNFRKPRPARSISCVVLHATATKGLESPREWLCSPESKVSAHYLLAKDGELLQLVDEDAIAWHAGASEWRGRPEVNAFSVGIELVNANDGRDSYPEPQIEKCAQLVAEICTDYKLAIQDVVGHKDIAPGRKTDPAGFPWDDFKMRLADLGVPSRKEAA